MSQSSGEVSTNQVWEQLPGTPDVAIGSVALLDPDTFDAERWAGEGGACPTE